MLQIENTLVSLDIIERFFVCNIEACRGECCIDGDAGAPITPDERRAIEAALPAVWEDLSPAAQAVIQEQGVAYIDEEADLVTSIVDGRDCVFTCYGNNGICYCALEKAYREGRSAFLSLFRVIFILCECKVGQMDILRSTTTDGRFVRLPRS